jgi:hypothetical protein
MFKGRQYFKGLSRVIQDNTNFLVIFKKPQSGTWTDRFLTYLSLIIRH